MAEHCYLYTLHPVDLKVVPKYGTVQYSKVKYGTVQYGTVKYNTCIERPVPAVYPIMADGVVNLFYTYVKIEDVTAVQTQQKQLCTSLQLKGMDFLHHCAICCEQS